MNSGGEARTAEYSLRPFQDAFPYLALCASTSFTVAVKMASRRWYSLPASKRLELIYPEASKSVASGENAVRAVSASVYFPWGKRESKKKQNPTHR